LHIKFNNESIESDSKESLGDSAASALIFNANYAHLVEDKVPGALEVHN
jgi:hypothetical protein